MPSNYVIFSTQRSGSTFFCECLRRTGCLGAPDERLVFLEYGLDSLNPEKKALRQLPLRQVIEAQEASQRAACGQNLTGWKIMWSTIEAVGRGVLPERLDADAFLRVLDESLAAPKFVFFERLNKVAQAISHAVLQQTRISHVRNERDLKLLSARKQALELSYPDVSRNLRKLLRDEERLLTFIARNRLDVLHLTYEELCGDVPGSVARVAQHAGIEMDRRALRAALATIRLKRTSSTLEQGFARAYLAHLVGPGGDAARPPGRPAASLAGLPRALAR